MILVQDVINANQFALLVKILFHALHAKLAIPINTMEIVLLRSHQIHIAIQRKYVLHVKVLALLAQTKICVSPAHLNFNIF